MIKVLIVDDEQIVREGIKFIIDKNFDSNLKIVGMAKSGREAIELCEDLHPQIVLMDIQMPGINGIEAIRKIKEIDRNIKFIIVSAYEQFDYAKSAVELKVTDYILKPINQKKLIETLNKVIRTIQEEKFLKIKEIETQEKLDKILPVLEIGYIYSIIMNTSYQKESADYHSLMNIKKSYAYMMIIELGEGDNYASLSNKIGKGIKGTQEYAAIRRIIKYKCNSIVGPLMLNRIPIMVYEDMPVDDYQQRVEAVELAEKLQKRIKDIINAQVYIGIGCCYKLDRMNLSYNEAAKAITKMTDESVLHIEDAVSYGIQRGKLLKLKSDQEVIISKVEDGNLKEIDELIRKFFLKLGKLAFGDIELAKSVITELMVLVYAIGYRNMAMTKEVHIIEYLDEIKGFTKHYELESYCLSHIKKIATAIKAEKENKVSSVIEEAMAYINKNYNRDIKLNDVAQEVAISPQYFSKIFKKELGENFIEYLTKVRIGHAKTMLKGGKLSVKEICFEIGYHDPNYFSRLFKKIEGISPTEYN